MTAFCDFLATVDQKFCPALSGSYRTQHIQSTQSEALLPFFCSLLSRDWSLMILENGATVAHSCCYPLGPSYISHCHVIFSSLFDTAQSSTTFPSPLQSVYCYS